MKIKIIFINRESPNKKENPILDL